MALFGGQQMTVLYCLNINIYLNSIYSLLTIYIASVKSCFSLDNNTYLAQAAPSVPNFIG